MINPFITLVVILTAVALSPAIQAGKTDDTLNVAFMIEAATMDAYMTTSRNGGILARHLYDSLLYKEPFSGEIKPALAKSYQFIDDTTMEFELREGVTFHNGEPFDADDVVYTLNKVSDPAYGAKTQLNVDWIKQAEKMGPYQVKLTMKKPFPLALEMLAGPIAIYPNEYYEKVGPEGMGTKPIGTGPYKMVKLTPGTRWVMERFENYYADSPKGKPAIKNLVIRVLPERNTQYAELLAGKLDWIWKIPPDQAEKLAKMPKIQIKNTSVLRIDYIHFDVLGKVKKSPVNELKVRQAIAYAINRQGIVTALTKRNSQVIHTACNPTQFGCTEEVVKYEYDPERAKQLLVEAGYPEGFEIEMVTDSTRRTLAEAIMGDLAKVNIKVKLNIQQYAAAREKWRAGQSPMTFTGWGSYGIADVAMLPGNFFTGSADDLAGDAEVKAWLEKGDSSIDSTVRQENYAKALKKIAAQVYWLPLWTHNVYYGLSKDLDFTLPADEYARFFLAKWKTP